LLLAAAAGLIAAVAHGQPSTIHAQSQYKTVSVRYKFRVGEVLYFRGETIVTGSFTGAPGVPAVPVSTQSETAYHETVVEVNADDGVATLEVSMDGVSTEDNGTEATYTDAQMAQLRDMGSIRVSPTGRVLSSRLKTFGGVGIAGIASLNTGLISALPAVPFNRVKVGDTWDGTLDAGKVVSTELAGFEAPIEYTLFDLTKFGSDNIAAVSEKVTGTFNPTVKPTDRMQISDKLDGVGTLQFDMDAGIIHIWTTSMAITLTFTPTPNAPANMTQIVGKLNMSTKLACLIGAAPAPAPAAPAQ